MDGINSCLDNRGIPSLFLIWLFTPTLLSRSFLLLLSFSVTLTFFPLQLTEEGGGLIKSLLRKRQREGIGRRRGRGGGVGPNQSHKSIWGVEIFNTINKQGESGGRLRRAGEGEAMAGRRAKLQRASTGPNAAPPRCSAALRRAVQSVSTGIERGLLSSVRRHSELNLLDICFIPSLDDESNVTKTS